MVTVWEGACHMNLKDGEYGIGADSQLSIAERVKVGYVKNNIFYPYY
jgi:hypothetical protein